MSNHLTCPECGILASDSVWPAEGFGNFITDHTVDSLRGREDPATIIQSGKKMYFCKCNMAIFIFGTGWLTFFTGEYT